MSLQDLYTGIRKQDMTRNEQLAILEAHLPAGSKRPAAADAAAAASKPNEKKAKVESESESDVSDDEECVTSSEDEEEDPDHEHGCSHNKEVKEVNLYKEIRREVHDGQKRSFAQIAEEMDGDFTKATIKEYYIYGCELAEEHRKEEVTKRLRRVHALKGGNTDLKKRAQHAYREAKAKLERHEKRTEETLAANKSESDEEEEEEDEDE